MNLEKKAKICYNKVMFLQKTYLRATAWASLWLLWPGRAAAQQDQIFLIEPLGGGNTLPAGDNAFIEYFNQSSDWLFRVAVGFTVMWVLIGGVMFIISGNNQSRRSEAITRISSALIGLLILLFAGVILRTLNSLFFVE